MPDPPARRTASSRRARSIPRRLVVALVTVRRRAPAEGGAVAGRPREEGPGTWDCTHEPARSRTRSMLLRGMIRYAQSGARFGRSRVRAVISSKRSDITVGPHTVLHIA